MAVESIETGQAQSGWKRPRGTPSLAEVFGSIKTRPTGSFWRKLVAFLGPGYLVAVGYMDPGNWATSLAGGSKFGYTLLVVALHLQHHGDRAAGAVRAARHRRRAATWRRPAATPFPRWVVLAAVGCWPRSPSSPPTSPR